ncbi:hypothetical protein [Nonomuraea bangladeshensis]|uniref:hypothetical protein n=1 Tax=Nonomuraea bangladeshensis TaxID=404385 RepID=UPI0031D92352
MFLQTLDELIRGHPIFLAFLRAQQHFTGRRVEITDIHQDCVLGCHRMRHEVWDGHVVLQAAVLVDRLTIYAYFL